MKCPKCGSNKVACFPNQKEHSAYCRCHSCNNIFDYDEKKARLDKVLAKFDSKNIFYIVGGISLEYRDNNFYITSEDEYSYCDKPISLDTVEHLIKDMEA